MPLSRGGEIFNRLLHSFGSLARQLGTRGLCFSWVSIYRYLLAVLLIHVVTLQCYHLEMIEPADDCDPNLELTDKSTVNKRSTRTKTCPGCKTPHADHYWGTMANKVMGSTDEKHTSQANERTQILPDDNLDKEVASLMEKLKNLEIEEQSLLRKRRIKELKKMVEQKQKSVHDLSREEEGQSTFMPTVTSATMYDDASVFYPVVTTRNLKKMAGKTSSKASRQLVGPWLGAIGAGSEGGLNLDFDVSNRLSQGKCYTPHGVNQLNVSSTSNLLDVKGQADLLLQPKASGKCSYLKITDFFDNIIQRDSEKVEAQNGVTKQALSFGPEKPKLENISVYQYLIASAHILNFLVEGGQIRDFEDIKQYLAYLIKTMELATRFEWKSVLIYDDQFRQLQALYAMLSHSHC